MSSENLAPRGGLSHVRGSDVPPLLSQTIPQFFRNTVERFGDRQALVFCEEKISLTYTEFGRAVGEIASGLFALGLEKGDRVGIWSPNRVEWVLTQFATAQLGLILVNINPAYRHSELTFSLNKVGCKALIAAKRFKSSNYEDMIRQIAPEIDHCACGQLDCKKLPQLRSIIIMGESKSPGMHSFDDLYSLGRDVDVGRMDWLTEQLHHDDAINIQFTSGTTGQPKGATLSHYNIVNNARYVTDRICLTEQDRLALPVPLYHCFGMVMGVLGAVSKGAAMVFPSGSFDPAVTLDVLESEGCNAVYGVPTMFVAMLSELEQKPRNLSTMRTGIMSGAPCPEDVMHRVNKEMNMAEVTVCYGMTETSPVSFHGFVDDSTDKRCQTVGRVLPHLEVKIINENDEIVKVGEKGQLCTKGYSVMKGYWDDDEQSRDSIKDGWMHSGDLAVFDPQGYCQIVGRLKDMIIRGGENIFPREIEDCMIRHPNISDVQVFGIADQKFGEIVCAWVIRRSGKSVSEAELQEFVRGQLSYFKVPAYIRFVDEFPLTVTGKPRKFIMRQQMTEWLVKLSGQGA